MITLFGIPNCSTVKKARDWLAAHQIAYTFHDFKKQGLSAEMAQAWLQQSTWQRLINQAGMTWRNLPPALKSAVVDEASACQLMLSHHSVIKRPILMQDANLLEVGFDAMRYAKHFSIES